MYIQLNQGVIVQHHVATLIYLIIPFRFPDTCWLMGVCLSVEVNTWLLIARRVFNKQGFGPWVIGLPPFFSIRIKMISILFYVTWISIRCILYPIIMKVLWQNWMEYYTKYGSIFYSRWFVSMALHSVFCLLNFKWTFDLFMSKLKAWKLGKNAKIDKGLWGMKQQQMRNMWNVNGDVKTTLSAILVVESVTLNRQLKWGKA
jgi:hypothetical protein